MTQTSTTTVEAHSDREHSDIVGGSSAERVINCPGSVPILAKLPDEVKNKSSIYADEGTALHEAMAYILENDIVDPDEILGMTFGESDSSPEGFKMTRERLDAAVIPCLDFFDALCEELEQEGGVQFLVEKRCQLPGIPGAFGTSDIIFRTDKRSGIVDWKFGEGKQVLAGYPETIVDEPNMEKAEVIRPNSQLCFYARAAAHTFPNMVETKPDWPVDLYIVQPRSRHLTLGDPIFSHCRTTYAELDAFRFRLVAAVAEAQGKEPRTKRGGWCEFQACRSVCPHHTGPLLDLAKLDLAKLKKAKDGGGAGVNWSELYEDFLPLIEIAEANINELRAQAHSFMEAGRTINGWKLVPKRATEKYVDADGAQRHAIGLGCTEQEVLTEPELKSPAQLAIVMEPHIEGSTKKARTVEARRQISEFTENVSSGTTMARDTDGRVDVTPTPTLLKNLADKLSKL